MNNLSFKLNDDLVASEYGVQSPFSVSQISSVLLQEIKAAIQLGEIKTKSLYEIDERLSDHLLLNCDLHGRDIEQKLNDNQRVICLHHMSYRNDLIKKLHDEIRVRFEKQVGSPFVFVNTRAWLSTPNGARFGPNEMHTDGFAAGHMKVMVYLQPLDIDHGYLIIKGNKGNVNVTNLPAGTAVLFRNSDIFHSGVPGNQSDRGVIEITLMRAMMNGDQIWPGHFYGRHLESPSISINQNRCEISEGDFLKYYIPHTKKNLKLNIGSGRRAWGADWACLDEIQHKGVTNITFSETVQFPFEEDTFSLIYSSHCFEHLSDDVIRQIMKETIRVSMSESLFLLKIPNYDWFLSQYRINNKLCMDNKGVESILWTWDGKIKDSFINRVAMMFCGYWNKSYGDHFTGLIGKSSNAYHGPPRVREGELERVFLSNSPREIVKKLRVHALADPGFSRFNHQNAWSSGECIEYFSSLGWSIITTNTKLIIDKFGESVPDLKEMAGWSSMFLFKKSIKGGERG